MEIHILSSEERIRAKKIWTSLEKDIPYVPFNTQWDYIETWLEIYGKTTPHWFLYGEHNNMEIGIILLVKHVGRNILIPIKSFSIGPDGESYRERTQLVHNAILVREEFRAEFLENLLTTLTNEFTWDEISLEGLYQGESICSVLDRFSFSYLYKKDTEFLINLGEARKEEKDMFSLFSYDIRYRIRRSIRALGEVSVVWANSEQQAERIYNELISLHQKTWNKRGKSGAFASTRFTQFHLKLIKKLISKKRVGLVKVESEKAGIIGCLYFYIDGDTVVGCQCGFATFNQAQFPDVNLNRIKPGYVTHALCIQECLKRGLNFYSFGTGMQIYKKELSNTTRTQSAIYITKGMKPKIRQKLVEHYLTLDNRNSSIVKPIYALYSMLHNIL